jgi:hypothetical protein
MYNFLPNRRYNFMTRAPSVIGGSRTAVKVKAVLDYSMAVKYDTITQKARAVYPYLPAGTNEDPTHYTYLLLESIDKGVEVLAYEWIDVGTVTTADVLTLTVTIPIGTMDDTTKIRDALTLMGYSGFTIKTSSVTTS